MNNHDKLKLVKEHADLPDSYEVRIIFIDQKEDIFSEVVSHMIHNGVMEIITAADTYHWVVMQNVKTMHFDKRYSRVAHIAAELRAKKLAEEAKKLAANNGKAGLLES